MAIREHFSRMVRKSISSSSSSGTTRSDDSSSTSHLCHPNGAITTTTISATPHCHDAVPRSTTSSRLAKIAAPWRSRRSTSSSKSNHHHKNAFSSSSAAAAAQAQANARSARLHPSERPLTEQNIRHQEMLGTYRLNFGRTGSMSRSRRRLSRGTVRSSFSGVSPGNSRPGSVDYGGPGGRRMSSFGVAPPTSAAAA
ncbi:hypothetical protein BD289DRAFT_447669 [Coniella lustricola]|uniref:Uncharacterized protein n=1 Tax=Coniella lustricola TaxID=2025994 RepID=A0A2T2ZSV4_9PEZI|nr:hypothetical protein BD289DRAFT_447669 [Coniella lustricola]